MGILFSKKEKLPPHFIFNWFGTIKFNINFVIIQYKVLFSLPPSKSKILHLPRQREKKEKGDS